MYLGCIAIAALFGVVHQTSSGLLAAATFSCNFPNVDCGWFAGHSWSLAYEEQFYLVFPVLFVVCGRRLGTVALFLLLALMAYPTFRYFARLDGPWRDAAAFTRNLSFICAGVVAAVYNDQLKRWAGSSRATVLLLSATALLPVLLALEGGVLPRLRDVSAPFWVAANDYLLPVCLAWIMVGTVHTRNRLTAILDRPMLQFLGKISCSLYLWQMLFTGAPDVYDPDSMWLLSWPIMILAATVSYYLIERPSSRIGRALLRAAAAWRVVSHRSVSPPLSP